MHDPLLGEVSDEDVDLKHTVEYDGKPSIDELLDDVFSSIPAQIADDAVIPRTEYDGFEQSNPDAPSSSNPLLLPDNFEKPLPPPEDHVPTPAFASPVVVIYATCTNSKCRPTVWRVPVSKVEFDKQFKRKFTCGSNGETFTPRDTGPKRKRKASA